LLDYYFNLYPTFLFKVYILFLFYFKEYFIIVSEVVSLKLSNHHFISSFM